LPTVLTPDGERLSKRHGARGVLQYRDDGYLPEAIVNYLARLGWAHGDAEVFSVEEFVGWFNLEGLTASPARFDPEKLKWLNHEHIKRLPEADVGRRLAPFLAAAGLDVASGPSATRVAALLKERSATLAEMARAAEYFYASTAHLYASGKPAAMLAERLAPEVRPALLSLFQRFSTTEWTRASITQAIRDVASEQRLKPGQVMMPLRTLVTGAPQTPPIDAVLELVGRDATRERMARGLKLEKDAL
jgi:glutamyl-tRNA synthetase